MNFSSISLIKLQRLSRVVKKELQVSVRIGSREGIGELLRRAASESRSARVFESYSDFSSTLTEQDKVELITYNVSVSPESNSMVREILPQQDSQPEEDSSSSQKDRRKISFSVKPERRKKELSYRGVAIKNDRRQQDLIYHGPDNRKQGQAFENAEELTGQHTYHGRSYRGVAIEEEEIHHDKAETKKKKPQRMYRGQLIDDD